MTVHFPIAFFLLGVLLTIYGIITNSDEMLYNRSLGINVNLWSGIGMLIFGLLMLFLVYLGRRKEPLQGSSEKKA